MGIKFQLKGLWQSMPNSCLSSLGLSGIVKSPTTTFLMLTDYSKHIFAASFTKIKPFMPSSLKQNGTYHSPLCNVNEQAKPQIYSHSPLPKQKTPAGNCPTLRRLIFFVDRNHRRSLTRLQRTSMGGAPATCKGCCESFFQNPSHLVNKTLSLS